MKAEHSKLMDKVLQSLDWNSILEVYKVFKMGVGGGNEVIPGLKRKPFSEDLDKNDIKNELKTLIKHAIKNHITQLSYGHWIIYWVSDEWELDSEFDDEIDEDEMDEMEEDFVFVLEPQLEVIYSPQRISIKGEITPSASKPNENVNLEEMLEKSLKNEDYELATKIRDLIKAQNK